MLLYGTVACMHITYVFVPLIGTVVYTIHSHLVRVCGAPNLRVLRLVSLLLDNARPSIAPCLYMGEVNARVPSLARASLACMALRSL